MTDPTPGRPLSRIWNRFALAQQMARFTVFLLVGIAIATAIQTVEVIPEFLSDAPEQSGGLLTRMWPMILVASFAVVILAEIVVTFMRRRIL